MVMEEVRMEVQKCNINVFDRLNFDSCHRKNVLYCGFFLLIFWFLPDKVCWWFPWPKRRDRSTQVYSKTQSFSLVGCLCCVPPAGVIRTPASEPAAVKGGGVIVKTPPSSERHSSNTLSEHTSSHLRENGNLSCGPNFLLGSCGCSILQAEDKTKHVFGYQCHAQSQQQWAVGGLWQRRSGDLQRRRYSRR